MSLFSVEISLMKCTDTSGTMWGSYRPVFTISPSHFKWFLENIIFKHTNWQTLLRWIPNIYLLGVKGSPDCRAIPKKTYGTTTSEQIEQFNCCILGFAVLRNCPHSDEVFYLEWVESMMASGSGFLSRFVHEIDQWTESETKDTPFQFREWKEALPSCGYKLFASEPRSPVVKQHNYEHFGYNGYDSYSAYRMRFLLSEIDACLAEFRIDDLRHVMDLYATFRGQEGYVEQTKVEGILTGLSCRSENF